MINQSMKEAWNALNAQQWHQPLYPHDRIVAWTFRNFPRANANHYALLDAGCGSGRHALFWAKEGYRSFACDFTESAIEITAQRAHAAHLPMTTKICPAEDLAFEDASFDGLLSFGVFYYLAASKKATLFDEIYRVLKPNAKALVVLRSIDDDRCVRAVPQSDGSYLLADLGDGAPSCAEAGMTMIFLSHADIVQLTRRFADVLIDRMVFTDAGGQFTNSDWYIQLTK